MDEFESKRKHRNSHSSVESLPSSNPSPTSTSHPHPQYPSATSASGSGDALVGRSFTVKEGRRSINFTRGSLDKEGSENGSGKRREGASTEDEESHAGDRLTRKFVGRLRALTGGREREGKTYSGT